jgi:hypothetical protein
MSNAAGFIAVVGRSFFLFMLQPTTARRQKRDDGNDLQRVTASLLAQTGTDVSFG